MFETTLKPQPDFENKMYDIMYQIAEKVSNDMKQENDLPYMLSKRMIAKEVFGGEISAQSLDTHILNRPDFPKVHIGNRVFYPRDDVLKWFRNHKEVGERFSPKLGVV